MMECLYNEDHQQNEFHEYSPSRPNYYINIIKGNEKGLSHREPASSCIHILLLYSVFSLRISGKRKLFFVQNCDELSEANSPSLSLKIIGVVNIIPIQFIVKP